MAKAIKGMVKDLKGKMKGTDHDVDIRVINCRDLDRKDHASGNDPYFKLMVNGKSKKTTVKHNAGRNADWNETFHFKGSNLDGELEISCYDDDPTFDDYIGRANIPLRELVNTHGPKSYQLVSKKDDKRITGYVTLEATTNLADEEFKDRAHHGEADRLDAGGIAGGHIGERQPHGGRDVGMAGGPDLGRDQMGGGAGSGMSGAGVADSGMSGDRVADSGLGGDRVADSGLGGDRVADSGLGGDRVADRGFGRCGVGDSGLGGDRVADSGLGGGRVADSGIGGGGGAMAEGGMGGGEVGRMGGGGVDRGQMGGGDMAGSDMGHVRGAGGVDRRMDGDGSAPGVVPR
jgi:hypothetical protein